MKLIYQGDHTEVIVPLEFGGEIRAKKGEVVNFPDTLAKGLLVQKKNWRKKGARK